MPHIVREATVEDVPALAALHVQTFQETHGGGPPVAIRHGQWHKILTAQDPNDFTFVIEDNAHALVAFARGTLHDGGVPGFQGELNKIYVLRRCHRQGLGARLLCHVTNRFLSRRVHSMLLFGDAGNPSNGFYEHFGAERLVSPAGEFHGGYGWVDLGALAHRCSARSASRQPAV